jgi:hypothetical protein
MRACSARSSVLVESVCAVASRKLVDCGSSGGDTNCTPDAACAARCVLDATCADIIDPISGGPFATCAAACSGG